MQPSVIFLINRSLTACIPSQAFTGRTAAKSRSAGFVLFGRMPHLPCGHGGSQRCPSSYDVLQSAFRRPLRVWKRKALVRFIRYRHSFCGNTQRWQYPLPKGFLCKKYRCGIVARVKCNARCVANFRLITKRDTMIPIKQQTQRTYGSGAKVKHVLHGRFRSKAQPRNPQRLADHRRAKGGMRPEKHERKPSLLAVAQKNVFTDGHIRMDKRHGNTCFNGICYFCAAGMKVRCKVGA